MKSEAEELKGIEKRNLINYLKSIKNKHFISSDTFDLRFP